MTDNVIEFGKKPKQATPPAPVHGDMTGYQTARAISHHFGITISNDDAIKLDRALRATVYHSMEQARKEEREACAKICEDAWMAFTQPSNGRPSLNPFPELRFAAEKIRARGNQ
jgi:hypothetical protein